MAQAPAPTQGIKGGSIFDTCMVVVTFEPAGAKCAGGVARAWDFGA